ncbi:TolC family protein [Fibrivirga algicola]|jgi:outer membrane protein TolC|uniref:TolC family protein n=1 Tax=Fibrivirga algicola TaxID=2950420 RepID=A0ABX0QN84_9BACT|nr:TolC family protein [Fibrivirga algicola]NID13602.1 TolC family protein [Fibrivirga algicola]
MPFYRANCFWYVGLLGFSLSLLGGLQAQPLNIEAAVDQSLRQFPTLATQRSAIEALRANTDVLRANRLPNLRLHSQTNIGTANGLSGSYFSLGLIVPTSGARRESNSGRLATGNIALATADWEFYNFGRFRAEDQLVRADVAVGEAQLDREQFSLRQSVIGAYLDVFWTQQTLRLEGQNLARVDTVRRIIGNLVRNGIKPGLDSSLANVALSRAKLAYQRVEADYQQARVLLGTLTGQSATTLQIDTTFRADPLLIGSPPAQPTPNHPLLRVGERLVTRQTAEIDLIRKTALPRLSVLAATWARGTSLGVDNEFGPLGSGLGYNRTNYLLGFAATVNLPDFKRAGVRVRQQQFRIEQARSQLAVQQIDLQNTLLSADAQLAVVGQQLAELPNALRAARDAYAQRLSLYNNGVETILNLTDALNLLITVEREVVQTRTEAVRLRFQRAQATDNFADFYTLFRS